MDELWQITGDTLAALHAIMVRNPGAYSLRLAVDDGQLKVKVDHGTWTLPLGPVATGDDAR